jgi:hypothetical protein
MDRASGASAARESGEFEVSGPGGVCRVTVGGARVVGFDPQVMLLAGV